MTTASLSTFKCRCTVFTSAKILFYVQLCKQSLDKWLRINGTQFSRPLPRMKSWFRQIVSAAAYIHEKGLIHRDLKVDTYYFNIVSFKKYLNSAQQHLVR